MKWIQREPTSSEYEEKLRQKNIEINKLTSKIKELESLQPSTAEGPELFTREQMEEYAGGEYWRGYNDGNRNANIKE